MTFLIATNVTWP